MLTDAQKAKRLAWCRSSLNTNWKKYLFTDEAPFWQTGVAYAYYSRPGTTPRMIPSVKHPAKINVWGGVSYYGKTDLKVMGSNETLTSERYRQVIQEYVIDNAAQLFGERAYVLLHDGAPAHRARATQSWLEENGVSETKDFSPNYPDLNIIENVWAIMKRNMYGHRLIYNTSSLKLAVKRYWNKIDLSQIRVLVASMPRRIKACIDAEGGSTKY